MKQIAEMKEGRPYLSPENAEKVRKIAHENGMSPSQVLNRILDSVSIFQMHQIITFIVEVRHEGDATGRKVSMRRQSNWNVRT